MSSTNPIIFPPMAARDPKVSRHVHFATVINPWLTDIIILVAALIPRIFAPLLHNNAVGDNPPPVSPEPYDPLEHAGSTAAQQTAARSEHSLSLTEHTHRDNAHNRGLMAHTAFITVMYTNLDQQDRDISKGANNSFMASPIIDLLTNLRNFYSTAPPSVIADLITSQSLPWLTTEAFQSQLSRFHKTNTCYETLSGSAFSPTDITDQLMTKSTSGPLAAAFAFTCTVFNHDRPRVGRDIAANKIRDPAVLAAQLETVFENLSAQDLLDATANYVAASLVTLTAAHLATLTMSGSNSEVKTLAAALPSDNKHITTSHNPHPKKGLRPFNNATTPAAAQHPTPTQKAALPAYVPPRSTSPKPITSTLPYCSKHGTNPYHTTVQCNWIKNRHDPAEKAYYLAKR